MSIERMEHVTVLVPAAQKAKLVEWLFARREIHVEPFGETGDEWRQRFAPLEEDAGQAEEQSSQLGFVVSFLLEYADNKPDFLTSIFPVKIRASNSDVHKAAGSVDTEKIHTTCQALGSEIEAAAEERERLQAERERLANLSFIKVDIGALRAVKHVAVMIASAPSEASARFVEDDRVVEKISVDAGSETKRAKVYILSAAAADAALLKEIASDYGLREYQIPKISGTIEEQRLRLDKQLEELAGKEDALGASARELAGDIRRYQLALAWWESEKTRLSQQAMLVSSPNIFAARGYVKRARLERLRRDVEEAIPHAAVVATESPEGEEPPVSLKWSRFVRPAGLLVKMFGLPKYSTFDPTPFVMFTFIIFFGMCFGDLLYGAMLIGVAALLKRKFKNQPGLIEFFRLFTYTGVSTMIFGVLTGSWGSDLTSYFGAGNPVDALRVKLTLLEPLQKPMVALGIAVGLGVVNQFYGLTLRFLSHAWRGDMATGFYDGGLWLIYFASLLALAFTGAGILPAWLMWPSLTVLALSALGLVLTQGREADNWPTRLVTGTISLYGILGTYGTTAFIGDVLSYSRLLALGLTTSVIGMAFNIISGFLKDIPYAGWGLFLVVCLAGHSFNFVMSILGAFVHPARLIFLEFFGRFYEGGGSPFRPFGFASTNVELTE